MYILVKGLNGRLIFIMDDQISFEQLMNELKGLLKKSLFQNKDYFPKAFFDFKSRILTEDEMSQFITILLEEKAVLFDGIKLHPQPQMKELKLIDRTIRGGEVLILDEDTLITGKINPGAIVYFRAKLYVMQSVQGTVEGISRQAMISCQEYRNATIRYFGEIRHDFTSFETTFIYYKDKQICVDKGDVLYV